MILHHLQFVKSRLIGCIKESVYYTVLALMLIAHIWVTSTYFCIANCLEHFQTARRFYQLYIRWARSQEYSHNKNFGFKPLSTTVELNVDA